MKPEISVIIPFLNEKDNIPFLVSSLNEFFRNYPEIKAEVLFVDDGSLDDSINILKSINHQSYTAKIIKFSKNFGSHAALRAGIIQAQGKYVTFMYADLQDPLSLIKEMYDCCRKENLDVIWGNRISVKSTFGERIFSKVYAKLMQKFALNNFPKNGFDIVFFNEKIKNELNKNIEPNSSIFLQILTLGFKHGFVSYEKAERKRGKSKWTVSKKIKLLIDSFVSFSFIPIRLVTIIGFILFTLGIIWTIYIITRALILNDLNPGWPTLVSILMVGFGITNISLGIIAEYLWRTLDASRGRSVFIIDEIIELNIQ